MHLSVAGPLRVAYYEAGPSYGLPVILLHGFPYSSVGLLPLMEVLAAHDFHCIAPDLRGYGKTQFLSDTKMRSGQQAALGHDLLMLMDALSIKQAILAGYDWGGRAACIVAALFPERVCGLVTCGRGYNIQNIAESSTPSSPATEAESWYVYYLNTERGKQALLHQRKALARYLWEQWSPGWNFQDTHFDAAAVSFNSSDFVDVVTHSYRHRLGEVAGDPDYTAIELELADSPNISVPTIMLHGEEDTITPPLASAGDAVKFVNLVEQRILPGVGHNPLEEAVTDSMRAIRQLARLAS